MDRSNLVKLRIMSKKRVAEMSLDSFFSSDEFKNYLCSLVHVMTKEYKRSFSIEIIVTDYCDLERVARVSSEGVLQLTLNNIITQSAYANNDREEMFRLLLGICFHEIGHLLFTPFDLVINELNRGYFSTTNTCFEDEMNGYVRAFGRDNIVNMSSLISNIIEDGFVDLTLVNLYYGYGGYLERCREFGREGINNDMDINDEGELLLHYIFKKGKYYLELDSKAMIERSQLFIDTVDIIGKLLSEAVVCGSFLKRLKLTGDVVYYYFRFLESHGQERKSSDENDRDDCEESTDTIDGDSNNLSNDFESKSDIDINDLLNQISDLICEDICIGNNETNQPMNVQELVPINFDTTTLPPSVSTGDIASDIVNSLIEDEISKENEQIAKNLQRKLSFSKNEVCSMLERKKFEDVFRSLDEFIMLKSIINLSKAKINERMLDETINGVYNGKRLGASLYRQDGKIMSRQISPGDELDMCISLRVDTSGSMSGQAISVARLTSYIMYRYARELNIPISINGDYASSSETTIVRYTDFEALGNDDINRIINMKASQVNDDVSAIWYAGEKLLNRHERVKLLFVISDGLPHDGAEGIKRLRDMVANFKRVGIKVIIASIGQDAIRIRNIYMDGISQSKRPEYIDLSDIRTMPKKFVNIVNNNI